MLTPSWFPSLRRHDTSPGRILVATPAGKQVSLGQVAKVEFVDGPPVIKSESGSLLVNIPVAIEQGIDIGGYLERMNIIVPITLAIIFILIYVNLKNVTETLITMLTLPFALIGGVWGMYWLDYNWSVAVAIGFIALAGLAAETGIIMHVYLDLAYKEHRKKKGGP